MRETLTTSSVDSIVSPFALQYFSTATDLQLCHGSGHEGSVQDKWLSWCLCKAGTAQQGCVWLGESQVVCVSWWRVRAEDEVIYVQDWVLRSNPRMDKTSICVWEMVILYIDVSIQCNVFACNSKHHINYFISLRSDTHKNSCLASSYWTCLGTVFWVLQLLHYISLSLQTFLPAFLRCEGKGHLWGSMVCIFYILGCIFIALKTCFYLGMVCMWYY